MNKGTVVACMRAAESPIHGESRGLRLFLVAAPAVQRTLRGGYTINVDRSTIVAWTGDLSVKSRQRLFGEQMANGVAIIGEEEFLAPYIAAEGRH